MTRESYVREAEKLLAHAEESSDPERMRAVFLQRLEHMAEIAEESAKRAETFLAHAVEAMERREQAHRVAARAEREIARIQNAKRAEAQRLRRNAQQRERYRRRRLTEPPSPDKRTGMHALAIEVDPNAYRALKLEARRRRTTIPKLLGEVLRTDLGRLASGPEALPRPRWQRTGDGRRANQHARIQIEDDAWETSHLDAVAARVTLARRIGIAVEAWASPRQGCEPFRACREP